MILNCLYPSLNVKLMNLSIYPRFFRSMHCHLYIDWYICIEAFSIVCWRESEEATIQSNLSSGFWGSHPSTSINRWGSRPFMHVYAWPFGWDLIRFDAVLRGYSVYHRVRLREPNPTHQLSSHNGRSKRHHIVFVRLSWRNLHCRPYVIVDVILSRHRLAHSVFSFLCHSIFQI